MTVNAKFFFICGREKLNIEILSTSRWWNVWVTLMEFGDLSEASVLSITKQIFERNLSLVAI